MSSARTENPSLIVRTLFAGRRPGRVVTAGLVVAFLLWLPAARAFADPVVHIVQPGDTLYNLARRYGTTVEAIEQANGLHNASLIYRGQHLVIPDSTGEDGSFQPMSRVSSPLAYTVQPGDTLVGIAVRFGVTVRELAAVNHLAQWDLIFAGQQLRLPAFTLGLQSNPVPPGVKRIEIDVSEQRMRVYEGDSLIWDWPASTGLPGYPTRYGRFQVLDKIPMAYSRPWKLWMPHWLGIYWAGGSENGIHSLPIINGRKLWAGYLGSRISYGCIVIGTAEGEQLFNWADVGTAVEIHE